MGLLRKRYKTQTTASPVSEAVLFVDDLGSLPKVTKLVLTDIGPSVKRLRSFLDVIDKECTACSSSVSQGEVLGHEQETFGTRASRFVESARSTCEDLTKKAETLSSTCTSLSEFFGEPKRLSSAANVFSCLHQFSMLFQGVRKRMDEKEERARMAEIRRQGLEDMKRKKGRRRRSIKKAA